MLLSKLLKELEIIKEELGDKEVYLKASVDTPTDKIQIYISNNNVVLNGVYYKC